MNISFLNPDNEEKLLYARICDLAEKAENRGASFTRFLNLREQEIAEAGVLGFDVHASFFGGFKESERKVLGVFSPWEEPSDESFPISLIKLTYSKRAKITHRDVLGSLMALGIERNCVGDIFFNEDSCSFSCINSVKDVILQELNCVNKFPVSPLLSDEGYSFKAETEKRTAVVSSMRLDAVVAVLTNKSRSVSSELIRKQKVFVNDKRAEKIDQEVKDNSVITVRGFGKFKIDGGIKETSKGRLRINFSKYI